MSADQPDAILENQPGDNSLLDRPDILAMIERGDFDEK